jgi:hypothetical protein
MRTQPKTAFSLLCSNVRFTDHLSSPYLSRCTDGGASQQWALIKICFWRTYSSLSTIWRSSLMQASPWRDVDYLGGAAARKFGFSKVPSLGGPTASDGPCHHDLVLI